MGQHAAHAVLGHLERMRRDQPAAAELGTHRDHALAIRRRGEGLAAALRRRRDVAHRRAECLQQADDLVHACGIGVARRERAWDVGERAAAGMEVEAVVGAGQELVLDPVGDLLRDSALGIAREQAIEVALVDRRGA